MLGQGIRHAKNDPESVQTELIEVHLNATQRTRRDVDVMVVEGRRNRRLVGDQRNPFLKQSVRKEAVILYFVTREHELGVKQSSDEFQRPSFRVISVEAAET